MQNRVNSYTSNRDGTCVTSCIRGCRENRGAITVAIPILVGIIGTVLVFVNHSELDLVYPGEVIYIVVLIIVVAIMGSQIFGKCIEGINRNREDTQGQRACEGPVSTDKQGEGKLGVALSGGGLRAASIAAGAVSYLQLADTEPIDTLSCVSGGGYIGSAMLLWKNTFDNMNSEDRRGFTSNFWIIPMLRHIGNNICFIISWRAGNQRSQNQGTKLKLVKKTCSSCCKVLMDLFFALLFVSLLFGINILAYTPVVVIVSDTYARLGNGSIWTEFDFKNDGLVDNDNSESQIQGFEDCHVRGYWYTKYTDDGQSYVRLHNPMPSAFFCIALIALFCLLLSLRSIATANRPFPKNLFWVFCSSAAGYFLVYASQTAACTGLQDGFEITLWVLFIVIAVMCLKSSDPLGSLAFVGVLGVIFGVSLAWVGGPPKSVWESDYSNATELHDDRLLSEPSPFFTFIDEHYGTVLLTAGLLVALLPHLHALRTFLVQNYYRYLLGRAYWAHDDERREHKINKRMGRSENETRTCWKLEHVKTFLKNNLRIPLAFSKDRLFQVFPFDRTTFSKIYHGTSGERPRIPTPTPKLITQCAIHHWELLAESENSGQEATEGSTSTPQVGSRENGNSTRGFESGDTSVPQAEGDANVKTSDGVVSPDVFYVTSSDCQGSTRVVRISKEGEHFRDVPDIPILTAVAISAGAVAPYMGNGVDAEAPSGLLTLLGGLCGRQTHFTARSPIITFALQVAVFVLGVLMLVRGIFVWQDLSKFQWYPTVLLIFFVVCLIFIGCCAKVVVTSTPLSRLPFVASMLMSIVPSITARWKEVSSIFTSDGGHVENLAILPLLWKQYSRIISVDSSEESDECQGKTLFNALRMAKATYGCTFFVEFQELLNFLGDKAINNMHPDNFQLFSIENIPTQIPDNPGHSRCLKVEVTYKDGTTGHIYWCRAKAQDIDLDMRNDMENMILSPVLDGLRRAEVRRKISFLWEEAKLDKLFDNFHMFTSPAQTESTGNCSACTNCCSRVVDFITSVHFLRVMVLFLILTLVSVLGITLLLVVVRAVLQRSWAIPGSDNEDFDNAMVILMLTFVGLVLSLFSPSYAVIPTVLISAIAGNAPFFFTVMLLSLPTGLVLSRLSNTGLSGGQQAGTALLPRTKELVKQLWDAFKLNIWYYLILFALFVLCTYGIWAVLAEGDVLDTRTLRVSLYFGLLASLSAAIAMGSGKAFGKFPNHSTVVMQPFSDRDVFTAYFQQGWAGAHAASSILMNEHPGEASVSHDDQDPVRTEEQEEQKEQDEAQNSHHFEYGAASSSAHSYYVSPGRSMQGAPTEAKQAGTKKSPVVPKRPKHASQRSGSSRRSSPKTSEAADSGYTETPEDDIEAPSPYRVAATASTRPASESKTAQVSIDEDYEIDSQEGNASTPDVERASSNSSYEDTPTQESSADSQRTSAVSSQQPSFGSSSLAHSGKVPNVKPMPTSRLPTGASPSQSKRADSYGSKAGKSSSKSPNINEGAAAAAPDRDQDQATLRAAFHAQLAHATQHKARTATPTTINPKAKVPSGKRRLSTDQNVNESIDGPNDCSSNNQEYPDHGHYNRTTVATTEVVATETETGISASEEDPEHRVEELKEELDEEEVREEVEGGWEEEKQPISAESTESSDAHRATLSSSSNQDGSPSSARSHQPSTRPAVPSRPVPSRPVPPRPVPPRPVPSRSVPPRPVPPRPRTRAHPGPETTGPTSETNGNEDQQNE